MRPEVVASKIKKIMKARKFKYADLAAHLEMSESGIKKLLAAKDFSFTKLTLIAEFLNLSLVELIESSMDQQFVEHKLNKEIEDYFSKNWNCFCFYWVLVAELTPLDEILEKYGLQFEDIRPYLFKLDSFNLIEYHSKDKIVINEDDSFTWGQDGKIVKKMLNTWAINFTKDCLNNYLKDNRRVNLFTVRMSKRTQEDLRKDLRELIADYTEKGIYDCNTGKKDISNFSLAYAHAPRSFVTRDDLLPN